MGEVVKRGDPAQDDPDAFRLMRTANAQHDERNHPRPNHNAVNRTETGAAHPGRVEPRQNEQHQEGAEHHAHAEQLVRDRAQDGVVRQEVPFRHDVRRRLQRIGRNEVIRVAQEIRHEADERRPDHKEHADAHAVLDGVVWVERHRVLRRLHVDAQGVVGPHDVQRGDMQEDHAHQHERQKVMQREEAVQRRLIDREPAP